MADKLRIQFDSERILDEVTVDEYIALENREIEAIKLVCGKFLLDEYGEYLPAEEGQALLGRQPMRVLLQLNDYLIGQAEEGAVPLANELESEEPS